MNRGPLLRLCQLQLRLTVPPLITPQQQLDRFKSFRCFGTLPLGKLKE